MTRMGRHVLPASEQALYVLNWLARRMRPGLKPYIPDFRRAFHHFCLHAGACCFVACASCTHCCLMHHCWYASYS
jgi:hypothetical protein